MSHLEEGTLHALLDGEIPSSDLAPIQAHLAACAECRARLEEERGLLSEADTLVGALEVPASTGAARSKPRVSWRRISQLAWAASVLAAIGLGYYARGLQHPVFTPARSAVEPNPPVSDSGLTSASGAMADKPTNTAEPVAGPPLRGGAKRIGKTERNPPTERAEAVVKTSSPALDSVAVSQRVSPVAASPAPPPAPPVASQELTGRLRNDAAERRVDPTKASFRLEEVVTAATPSPEPITLPDAVRRLGGSLRLIDGLVPLRLEAIGVTVRVVYPVSQGELVLSQQLIDGKVAWRLIAPAGFPADSLAQLRARVRE